MIFFNLINEVIHKKIDIYIYKYKNDTFNNNKMLQTNNNETNQEEQIKEETNNEFVVITGI